MNANLILAKELLSPPGDTIQETIDMMGMRQNELAERMGKTEIIAETGAGQHGVATATAASAAGCQHSQ